MYRLLLLSAVCLLAAPAQGQTLYPYHRYQVYEEEFTFFNVKTFHFQGTSSHRVNYVLTSYADYHTALQVNRPSALDPTSPTAVGSLICRLSGLKYEDHQFANGVLSERYSALYKAYKGGTVPPLSAIPDPSAADVSWEVNCNGECTLRVNWFVGPKTKPGAGVVKSYYSYTLHCRSVN